jgi:hypothetical protein
MSSWQLTECGVRVRGQSAGSECGVRVRGQSAGSECGVRVRGQSAVLHRTPDTTGRLQPSPAADRCSWHESCSSSCFTAWRDNCRSFQGFTCLLQLSTRSADFVVDALALRDALGPALAAVLADPSVEKVLHGADSDVLWLQVRDPLPPSQLP